MKSYDTKNIEIRFVENADLHENTLQSFNRYQVTKRVKYKENDRYLFKDDYFIDNWDEQKKRQLVLLLKQYITAGGIVAGAFKNNELVGFAAVENNFFGSKKEYLELSFIHISNEYRNQGIGRMLFRLCCEKAKEKGAGKLYIAAHPAEETQKFYTSMGCVPAAELNDEIFKKEPRDLQLEVKL